MAPQATFLNPQEYQVMPWKNGGGASTELAIYPQKAQLSDIFDWRISLAHIKESGSFSTFSGYDRVIVQTKGHPLLLNHLNQPSHELGLFVPYAFDGDWVTDAILKGNEAYDFNVMTNRLRYQSAVECRDLAKNDWEICGLGDFCFIWAGDGTVRIMVDQQDFTLNYQASLLIEKANQTKVQVLAGAGTLIVVHLKAVV